MLLLFFVSDSSSLIRIIGLVQPDEIYNLAAQSHVQVSFDVPEYSGDVDALGVLRILEACRILGLTKKTRIYQASTSELYGKVEEVPQRETTPFHPYSPYAIAKQYGFWMVKEYREAYGMFAVNGILFNHESERRGENFVTRKITRAAGRIAEGLQDHLELGNMDSLRDWGYAKDYVECMWMILQHETPEDFVIATGEPIKEYLDVHYQEKISLDFLAEHFFISKYYLTRVFKEQFGTSINSYLMNRRVTRAKFMLRFSGEKIEAIGYTCGLGAPHYFSRIFKQLEGISPSEYRERWQQESNNV